MHPRAIRAPLIGCLLALLSGCAPTQVVSTAENPAELPKPVRVLVYDFAVSPDEVRLDESVAASLGNAINGAPRSDRERAIGRAMSYSLSMKLTDRLHAMGLDAQRASGAAPPIGRALLLIKGQFLSIDEGNESERIVIGLGMGRSQVKTNVQVYETLFTGVQLVEQFAGDARSGFQPGMAESVGVGAAVGSVGAAAATSGAVAIGSEAFSANVEADAARTAEVLAQRIHQMYIDRGWIPPG